MDAKEWLEAHWAANPRGAPWPEGQATWEVRRITANDNLPAREFPWAVFPKGAP